MFFKKINNEDMWKKITTLRLRIKSESNFKTRVCWNCQKELNIFDFLSDNMEYTAKELLELWQNPLYEFPCCQCYKELMHEELDEIAKIRQSRKCVNCEKNLDIYQFARLYDALKINEIEETWLNPASHIFCSGYCEKYFYKIKKGKKT